MTTHYPSPSPRHWTRVGDRLAPVTVVNPDASKWIGETWHVFYVADCFDPPMFAVLAGSFET